jgi:hypothetical protein
MAYPKKLLLWMTMLKFFLCFLQFDPAGYSWLLDADPWGLSNELRCIMMLLMMKENLEESIKQFARIKEQYDQLCKENAELNKQKRVAILKNAKIVGMTTTVTLL